MDNPICANCHYMFTREPYAPCKCRLCLDPSSEPVKAFMRKQQVFGYRSCLVEHKPNDAVLSDKEIGEALERNSSLMRTEINKIFE